jgi:hypothetical protein
VELRESLALDGVGVDGVRFHDCILLDDDCSNFLCKSQWSSR